MSFERGMRRALRLLAACAIAGTLLPLSGCFTIAATGVAVGALVATDRRTIGAQTEDHGLELKAFGQLKPVREKGSVSVTSYNRKVLLTGQVPDEPTRRDAEAIVAKLDNQRGIHNELRVSPNATLTTSASDTTITARIKANLVEARDLQVNAIKVITEAGVAYLMGIVTRAEGDRAAQIASRTPGVLRVVTLFEYVTDDELARVVRLPAAKSAD